MHGTVGEDADLQAAGSRRFDSSGDHGDTELT